MPAYNELTPEEKKVIEEKGTEMPFSGEYEDFWKEGTYICRKCNTPLYHSTDKFNAHCGWPAFDDAIPGQVKETVDADGRRTEITCETCGAHLGHVFRGEGFTDTDTRHCVNSISMKFVPGSLIEGHFASASDGSKIQMATLGGGCFWCIEGTLRLLKGVQEVISGYSGGTTENPTYDEVCSKKTGHIEVVQITFDSTVISYKQLLEVFFSMHNPTTLNRQGNDAGEQYASVIFYHSDDQKQVADELIAELDREKMWSDPVVTKVLPLTKFWQAEISHQNYYENNSWQPYCQVVIEPKITKMREKWKYLLKENA